jgi:twinkle protein
MSECIEKKPHSCGSSDGLQVFAEGRTYSGYCFACSTYVPHPYGEELPANFKPKIKKKSYEEIQAELTEISGYKTVDLPDRKLKAEALEYFGVKVGLSQADGSTPTSHFYPYYKDGDLLGYKARIIEDKKMWAIGSLKGADLFGWEAAKAATGRTLFITEGECDAVALYQVLKNRNRGTKWADLAPPVVSLPSGAGSASKVISAAIPEIKKFFKEIVLVFDQDEQGEKAVIEVMKVAPILIDKDTNEMRSMIRAASLPAKDANDCLIQGREKALAAAVLFNAAAPKNTNIVQASDLFEEAREPAQWGLSWPYEKMTDLTRGIRFGETTYIGAGVKMGKSEFVNDIAAHCMREHGLKVFLVKPEEANKKTVKMVAGKMVGKFFHDPKVEFDDKAYDEGCKLIGDNLHLLNLYQHLGWESLQADIKAAAMAGCKIIMIDPITNLTNGINSGEANTILQSIAQSLSAMAMDLDLHIFIFCHLKAPTSGDLHERGGKVQSAQFAGSRAMMRSCNYMIGIEGNKDPDLPEEQRNLRSLVILEDREFGNVGKVPLYWDRATGLFNELVED